jgi:Mrp family chromosome partitioning ATPase
MSNIYAALQHTDRILKSVDKSYIAQVAAAVIPSTNIDVTMEQEMIDLYRHIDAILIDSPKIVLQFIGSRSGDGVSTIVREYASMATTRLGKSVLILDANQSERDQQHFFRITNNCGWDEAVSDPEAMKKSICRIGNSNLYVSGLSLRSGANPLLFDACQLKNLFSGLKMRFDLILLDSSLVTTGTDSSVLSRCADGVLLVLEADKTRWPVAEYMKSKVQNSGGNILGLIFNKRRYYIPEYLYKKL